MGKKIQIFRFPFVVLMAAILSCACDCSQKSDPDDGKYSKVLLLYSAGANNIWDTLEENILELKEGYVPQKNSKEALLVLSHLPAAAYGKTYSYDGSNTSPYLFRIYKETDGRCVMDTLLTMPKGTSLTDSSALKSALEYTEKNFPSNSYGMIFSSHGTGWLPVDYYDNPQKYEKVVSSAYSVAGRLQAGSWHSGYAELSQRQVHPGEPRVKSIGAEVSGTKYYEMELKDFFSNVPISFDYIIFDACLMGCVELAYQAREKCKYLLISPSEILSEGMDYTTMAGNLLSSSGQGIVQVAKDYYAKYKDQSSPIYRSATVTVIDCSKISALASVCAALSEEYRSEFASIDRSTVQPFFRDGCHWFYDLEDIFEKCGMTAAQKSQLEAALSECVVYKAATEGFLYDPGMVSSGYPIKSYCGLSMYLPIASSSYLNAYYQTLEWNKAVGLIK